VVDVLVELPWAPTHPSLYRRYDYDDRHLKLYTEANRDERKMQAYLDQYVYGVKDHFAYLERSIGIEGLLKQMAVPLKGY
jgi:glutaconate CoA-transferase subunit A